MKKLSCEQEEQLHKISKERDELEEAIDKVRGNLSKTEADKKELYQQVINFIHFCHFDLLIDNFVLKTYQSYSKVY